jgi:hypothetical protein
MGGNRKQHPFQSATEIPRLNREEFGLKDKELFHIWQSYYYNRLLNQMPAPKAADCLINHGISVDQVRYLVALGLEAVTCEYLRKGGKFIGQSMDMLN